MITLVLPTRDRATELNETLAAIAELGPFDGEVFVVDNASATRADCPDRLESGVPVRVFRNETNEGAAARNAGVRSAHSLSEWVVLLDDDSAPIDRGFLQAVQDQPEDVAAVMADIVLPDGSRERGGLPEVPVGCGVAVRRWAFLAAGGYDHAFGYYAEEYDLAAKLILADRRVVFDPRFRVLHRKAGDGRDMNLILERLVRNNGWVLQRYCPEEQLAERLRENESRYRAIAEKENATEGFGRGLADLRATIDDQARLPMDGPLWDRFTGLDAARDAIGRAFKNNPFGSARIIEKGKNEWVVRRVLGELGVEIVSDGTEVDVIWTMSPGPMLDAAARNLDSTRRVITPWDPSAIRTTFDRFGGIELRRAIEDRPAA